MMQINKIDLQNEHDAPDEFISRCAELIRSVQDNCLQEDFPTEASADLSSRLDASSMCALVSVIACNSGSPAHPESVFCGTISSLCFSFSSFIADKATDWVREKYGDAAARDIEDFLDKVIVT